MNPSKLLALKNFIINGVTLCNDIDQLYVLFGTCEFGFREQASAHAIELVDRLKNNKTEPVTEDTETVIIINACAN